MIQLFLLSFEMTAKQISSVCAVLCLDNFYFFFFTFAPGTEILLFCVVVSVVIVNRCNLYDRPTYCVCKCLGSMCIVTDALRSRDKFGHLIRRNIRRKK